MKYILTFLLLITIGRLEAQSSVDNQEYIEFTGCKILEYAIPDSLTGEFREKYDCASHPASADLMKHFSTKTTERALEIYKEILSVRNSPAMSLSTSNLSAFLTVEMFNDSIKYSKVNTFFKKHKGDAQFHSLLKEILDFPQLKQDAMNDGESSTGSKMLDEGEEERANPADDARAGVELPGFGRLTYQIDVFAWLFTLACLIILWQVLKNMSPSNRTKDYIHQKIRAAGLRKESPLTADRVDPRFDELKQNINQLNDSLKQLAGKVASTTVPMEINPVLEERVYPIAVEEKAPYQELCFLPTPNGDGSFNVSTISNTYREGASIYRMTKISTTRGKFEIEQDDISIRLALQYVELRVEPCCEAENGYTADIKQIRLIEPGELELQGDKWVIVKKSKIRYEY